MHHEKPRTLGSNIQGMLAKAKKEARDPMFDVLKDVLKMENRKKETIQANEDRIDNIQIQRSTNGIESIRMLHGYFNL